MDRHELDRMFDALAPSPGQEQELLEKLLQDGARRKKPMKNWKQMVAAAAAAALLVTAAAAATVPGLSRKLLEYLGVAPEDARTVELLAPGAVAVDITREDNGAVLHVNQILRDRTSIIVQADFTAPEGTALDMGDFNDPHSERPLGFRSKGWVWPSFLDAAGERLEETAYGSCGWKVLEDDSSQDGCCSLIFRFSTHSYEGTLEKDAAALWIPAEDFYYYAGGDPEKLTAITGDWSFEIPLPQQDIGKTWQVEQYLTELDGADVRLKQAYLSPMKVRLILSRENGSRPLWEEEQGVQDHWRNFSRAVVLTAKDGETVRLETQGSGGGTESETVVQFIIEDFIDVSRFQGGTLTLEWGCDAGHSGSTTIPLDGLTLVEQ